MNDFGTVLMWQFRRERARMAMLGLAAAVFVALLLGLSNSVRPDDVQELVTKLPPAFRSLMGMNEGDLFDLSRWVGLVHNHPVWLITILAFPMASALRGVAYGIDDGTLEIVLAQPIGRTTYYLALAAVVGLGTSWVLACSLLGGVIAANVITLPGDLSAATLFHLSVSGWALALSVAGIALLISVGSAGGGRPGSLAVGIVVGMFFLRFLANMVPGASGFRWVTVFGYHDTRQVIRDGLAAGHLLALIGVGLACAAVGLWAFRRKQLTF